MWKIIFSLLLTILPAIVLIRDLKFHDKRTRKHHNITYTIIVIWFLSSVISVHFIWSDSIQMNALIDGNNKLMQQIEMLIGKVENYQKDLQERDKKINELEEKLKQKVAKTQINRLIEDRESSSLKIAKQFPEEINQTVSSEFGTDGSKVAKFKELVDIYKEKIDLEYKNLTRDVEDICFKNFNQKEIKLIPDLKTEAQKIDDLYNRLQKYKESFERRVQETKLYQDSPANKK